MTNTLPAAQPKRGRPRLDPQDHSVQLTVVLPSTTYESLYQDAAANRVTIAAEARRRLQPTPNLKPTK